MTAAVPTCEKTKRGSTDGQNLLSATLLVPLQVGVRSPYARHRSSPALRVFVQTLFWPHPSQLASPNPVPSTALRNLDSRRKSLRYGRSGHPFWEKCPFRKQQVHPEPPC